MPRMNLTEAETKVVESLRRDEAKYNLGYNAGLKDARDVMTADNMTKPEKLQTIDLLFKLIKP